MLTKALVRCGLILTLGVSSLIAGLPTSASDGSELSYISIGEMAEGFSEYNLPQTSLLSGRTVELYTVRRGDAFAMRFEFVSPKVLQWTVIAGDETGESGYSEYIATQPREGYFFVEYIPGLNRAQMVSFVLDETRGIATWVFGQFPRRDEDTLSLYERSAQQLSVNASSVEILNANIGGALTAQTPRHTLRSSDLVGKRYLYQYSEKDAYEHIYVTDQLFTWHCVSGNEQGLADTDFAQIVKFEDDFYMIVWVEKIMHIVSTITIDYAAMRSSGAMAAFKGWDYGELVNVSSGALITPLQGIDPASAYRLKR